jgi:hypothetical protein
MEVFMIFLAKIVRKFVNLLSNRKGESEFLEFGVILSKLQCFPPSLPIHLSAGNTKFLAKEIIAE